MWYNESMIHPEIRGKEDFQLYILQIKPGWSYNDINSKINQEAVFKQALLVYK